MGDDTRIQLPTLNASTLATGILSVAMLGAVTMAWQTFAQLSDLGSKVEIRVERERSVAKELQRLDSEVRELRVRVRDLEVDE